MFEEYHTLTVYFPNKTKPIYIMNVPYDATCATIISKLYSLPIAKEYKGEIVIKCNNEIIHGNSLIDDDVIYVDLCVKQKEKKITKAFFFIFEDISKEIRLIFELCNAFINKHNTNNKKIQQQFLLYKTHLKELITTHSKIPIEISSYLMYML